MAILSEKRQKCFGLRRKDVRMRAIICDDDGRFAKKLEQLIMQYYRNMGMTIDTTVVTNPQNLLKRNDLANFDIAFLDADMKPIDGIEVGRALRNSNWNEPIPMHRKHGRTVKMRLKKRGSSGMRPKMH